MSDTVIKEFDWLRGRLNERVKSGEWSHVLDLHDILDVLREQEGIVSSALDKHPKMIAVPGMGVSARRIF